MNLPLAIFNLVPAYPLDGGRVLRAVLWFAGQDARWGSALAARVGQVAALGLLLAGVFALIDGTTAALSGLWLIMIAWFLYAGAASAQATSSVMEALRRLTVASIMDRNIGRVDASLSMQAFAEAQLLERRLEPAPQGFGVYRDNQLVGLMSLRQLGRIPASAWPHTRVERAMQPIELAPALEPGAPALGALHLIVDEGCDQVAVMADGRLLGLVTGADLAKASAQ